MSEAFDHWRITFASGRIVRVKTDEKLQEIVCREFFHRRGEPKVVACGSDDVGPDIDFVKR